MKFTPLTVVMFFGGVILIYGAIIGKLPQDIVKGAIDPNSREAKKPEDGGPYLGDKGFIKPITPQNQPSNVDPNMRQWELLIQQMQQQGYRFV